MKKFFKRILTGIVATVTCLSMGLNTFAAETTTVDIVNDTLATTDESIIMPRGTINGYASKTITPQDNKLIINCTSSGGAWVGSGMGVTVRCTSSSTGKIIGYDGAPTGGSRGDSFSGYVSSNGESYQQNLTQYEAKQYTITFTLPADCPSAYVQVWIYG